MEQTIDVRQPVSDIQLDQLKIEWVPRDNVKPNKYNPNKMTWQDRMLLRQSILEDGWTQPVVTLMDGTIVDGEQRWTVSGLALKPKDVQEIIDKMEARKQQGYPESDSILFRLREGKRRLEAAIAAGIPGTLAAITGGLVPITRVDFGDDAHKMISTIRHNRARGSHGIDQMSLITQDLIKLGLDVDDLETRLGMDDEEVKRMVKAAEGQMSQMQEMAKVHNFSPSTEVLHLADVTDPEAAARFAKSAEANQQFIDYETAKAARAAEIERQRQEALSQMPPDATQDDKDALARKIAAAIPLPPAPETPDLKKFVFFITPAENHLLRTVFEGEVIQSILALTRLVSRDPELKQRMQDEIAHPG